MADLLPVEGSPVDGKLLILAKSKSKASYLAGLISYFSAKSIILNTFNASKGMHCLALEAKILAHAI